MLERVAHADGTIAYRSPALAALGAPHLFTTRVGAHGAQLDLGQLDDATRATLRELAGLAPSAPFASLTQIHGARVHEVDAHGPPPGAEGDALVSSWPERALLVYAADCVPVLIASAGGGRVAAVHAGWRGLLAGAIPAALAALGETPAAAAIGPCLSLQFCEMGPEVAEQFERAGLEHVVVRHSGRRPHVDLRAAARLQLERAGCRAIDVSDRCTYRDAAELPSHRRDVTHGGAPRAGRIGALIGCVRSTRDSR